MNYPIITQIIENKKETKNIKTITFKHSGEMLPGQFFMIWIPKVDEIPMSVSYINKDIKGFTYRKIGEATEALYNLKKGDKIGIKGPYGNGFKINGKRILFVGGGTGIGMLNPAIEEAVNKKIKSTVIIGVKNKEELFFEKRLKKLNVELYISTDDGSRGYKGFASDIAKDLINKNRYTSILTCGPETMMKKIFELSKSIPFQASMERYMKCGFGICGQCTIGDGIRVCHEGPIFDGKTLKKIEDFGKFKKDASGRKIPI
jgi:dihydroorotate dehydrogenase electron transfer subunit